MSSGGNPAVLSCESESALIAAAAKAYASGRVPANTAETLASLMLVGAPYKHKHVRLAS